MILVTGATGFLGQAVCAALGETPHVPLAGRRKGINLADPDARWIISSAVHDDGVDTVIHLAYPGTAGIGTMMETPADLVEEMLQIDLNVIKACAQAQIKKLVCVGSVCSYPEHVPFPTSEAAFWQGYPEWVNAPYGIGKRMQLELLKVEHRQRGLNSVHLVLGNLYGPGDHSGHVIPSTIRKVLKAKAEQQDTIPVWGDGTVTREFLYVEDAARAIVAAALHPPYPAGPDPINVCSGDEISIRSLVEAVAQAVGWQGEIVWDPSKPNGQPRRWFTNVLARTIYGWEPRVIFEEGIRRTVAAWQEAGA